MLAEHRKQLICINFKSVTGLSVNDLNQLVKGREKWHLLKKNIVYHYAIGVLPLPLEQRPQLDHRMVKFIRWDISVYIPNSKIKIYFFEMKTSLGALCKKFVGTELD